MSKPITRMPWAECRRADVRSCEPPPLKTAEDRAETHCNRVASLRAQQEVPRHGGSGKNPNEAEDRIRRTGLSYRDLFRHAPVGLGLATFEGRVLACNPAMEITSGYSEEDLVSTSLEVLYENPGQREEVLDLLNRNGFLRNHELTLVRKDGTSYTASLTMTPVSVQRSPLLLTTLRDISDGKRARNALQRTNQVLETIFQNTHMQIAYLDQDLVYVRVNDPYAHFHGLRPEQLAGRTYLGLRHDRGSSEVLRRVLATGEPYFAVSQAFESPDRSGDSVTYWDWSLVPILDLDEHVTGLILMSKDVTERVKAEHALTSSQEQLFQAQKMEALGVLVAGVAHEINNPINQLLFNIPLMQRIWKDVEPLLDSRSHGEPERRYAGLSSAFLRENMEPLLANMGMAANRIASIVDDLKNFSRRSSAADIQVVRIETAVNNAIRLAQTTIRKSGVELSLALGEDLPAMQGNLHNLEQVILNLLINAIQAMEGRNGEVQIRTFLQNDRLSLSVSDNGNGVPHDIAERVFDPFVTKRQGQGGTGLGLSVTYNLVKAHGGDIHFTSRHGEGTTFTVSFPHVETRTRRGLSES